MTAKRVSTGSRLFQLGGLFMALSNKANASCIVNHWWLVAYLIRQRGAILPLRIFAVSSSGWIDYEGLLWQLSK